VFVPEGCPSTFAGAGSPEVLIVAEDGQAGGIGRYCVDLAALLGTRASVVCLCPGACDARSCWLATQCATHAVRLVRVPMPPRAWRRGYIGLVRLWRSSGRPAIHVNGRRGNFVSVAARLSVPGYRFVTTIHGLLGLHARRNALYRVIDLAASRAATAVIAVSADTRRRAIMAGVPRGKTIVILNGLGERELGVLGSVAERRAQLADGPARVGFLGRLSPEKGTHELLEVARCLLAENRTATLAVAGEGPDRAWMESASRALTESGRLTWHGPLADVARFLAEIDLLAMPSHNEGLPYVLLEAMAAGCAIVAFRVGGIPEVITDDSVGILVEPGELGAFVRAVVELAADPVRVRSLGRAAAAHVDARFALDDRLPLLAHVYSRESAPNRSLEVPPVDRAG
jgi:glycosyltransferase involved in cell wall biosynthesis